MKMHQPPYVGQVIIEKGFRTAAEAEEWMAKVYEEHKDADLFQTHVETHLWEPAHPIGGKEV